MCRIVKAVTAKVDRSRVMKAVWRKQESLPHAFRSAF